MSDIEIISPPSLPVSADDIREESPERIASAKLVKTVSVITIIIWAFLGFGFLVTGFLASAGGAWSDHKHYPLLGIIIFLIPLFVPAFMESLYKKEKYQEIKLLAKFHPIIFIVALLISNMLIF